MAGFRQNVQAELECNLLVWPPSFPDGHSKHDAFKVEEVGGKAVGCQIRCGTHSVEIDRPGQRVLFDERLLSVEQLVRHLTQIGDSLSGQLLAFGGREAGQPVHGKLGLHDIFVTVVAEAAFERRVAVITNGNLRLGRESGNVLGFGNPAFDLCHFVLSDRPIYSHQSFGDALLS